MKYYWVIIIYIYDIINIIIYCIIKYYWARSDQKIQFSASLVITITLKQILKQPKSTIQQASIVTSANLASSASKANRYRPSKRAKVIIENTIMYISIENKNILPYTMYICLIKIEITRMWLQQNVFDGMWSNWSILHMQTEVHGQKMQPVS